MDQYLLLVSFKSSLYVELQTLEGNIVHPNITKIKLHTVSPNTQEWQLKSLLEVEFSAMENEEERMNVAEDIAYTLLGFIGFSVTEGISLEQFEVKGEDGKGIIQKSGKFLLSQRQVTNPLPGHIIFDKAHRLSLHWVGRGLTATRPDDQLALFYAGAESVIQHNAGEYGEICSECGRPKKNLASQPMRKFLTKDCKIGLVEANKIIRYRGNMVHGRLSAVQKYDDFINVADQLLQALRNYYQNKFSIQIFNPDISFENKVRIYTETQDFDK